MSSKYSTDNSFLSDELTQKNVTATTSATELFTGGSRNSARQLIRIYNDGSRSVFVGPSGVTASGSNKGEELPQRSSLTLSIGDVGIFAITSSGTCNLVVTELA